ncbi:hypothetical protein Tco_0759889 [Tanacetum coccineum]
MLMIASPNGRCYLVDMLSSTIRWYVETKKGALYLVNRGDKVVDYLDLKPQDPDKIDWGIWDGRDAIVKKVKRRNNLEETKYMIQISGYHENLVNFYRWETLPLKYAV